ncbi:glycosyltransferase family 4 protein [Natronoflexus pectinivorans]|uniref:Glycosyltransferase involved in cell wall biosynthesis n=1 Tax=Natronoflexus pectinivorans TaxID=682526 RepID=A0A4R2GHY6_9BACT|nr:glycosyltransferase family 1 protein [Natronoflexus pectinivorans]TCO07883.1 glycosyltransferase involved in cell wall biosynthesis [Natronoflexus pectinivorans]
MVIGFDARFLTKIEQGTASYTSQLLEAMKPFIENDKIVLLNKNQLPGLFKQGDVFDHGRLVSNFTPINVLWGYHQAAKKYELDVIHTNYLSSVYKSRAKKVITIHDILFKTHKKYFPCRLRAGINALSRFSLPKADHIITVSHYTRSELEKYYPFLKGRIKVIYEAAAGNYSFLNNRQELQSNLLEKFSLKRDYLLYVGRFAPVKNLEVLLEWYLDREINQKGLDLVLVGKIDPAFPNARLSGMINNNPGVRVFQGLSNDELNLFYNGARLFYFASHGEGFGLPILEAMAAGCPVITSNTTSCDEIGGDAAFKVNPGDKEEIFAALDQLIDDEEKLSSMQQKGLERVKAFSWEQCAYETYKLYKQVLDEG